MPLLLISLSSEGFFASAFFAKVTRTPSLLFPCLPNLIWDLFRSRYATKAYLSLSDFMEVYFAASWEIVLVNELSCRFFSSSQVHHFLRHFFGTVKKGGRKEIFQRTDYLWRQRKKSDRKEGTQCKFFALIFQGRFVSPLKKVLSVFSWAVSSPPTLKMFALINTHITKSPKW